MQGISINTFDLEDQHPLVYGGDVPNTAAGYNGSESRYLSSSWSGINSLYIEFNISKILFKKSVNYRYCEENSLDKSKVRGKIVLCDWTYNGTIIAGAAGAIMPDNGFKDVAFSFPISSSYLSTNDGNNIYNYLY